MTRSTLGIAIASVLLSFLMMITRRKAVPQVIGFLAMENGLFFAATSATYGMPMVVELGIALDVLVGTLICSASSFSRSARPFDSLDIQPLEKLKEEERSKQERGTIAWRSSGVLGVPRLARRPRARRCIGDTPAEPPSTSRSVCVTLAAAAVLAVRVIVDGPLLRSTEQFFVDPFNVFLVALTAFVGFTTALFRRPYMRIEQEHGRAHRRAGCGSITACISSSCSRCWSRCSPTTSASCGWRWKAATLSTVLLVSLYRTPASLEAAWKYFILCGVGHRAGAVRHDPALLRRGEGARRRRTVRCCGPTCTEVQGQLEPTVLSLAFVFLLVGYGTKVGLVPLHNWLPDAHAEGPTPISAVLSGLLLNVALYAVVRCKVLVDGALGTQFAGQPDDGFRPAVGRGGRVLPLAPAATSSGCSRTRRSSTWAS